MIYSLYFTAFYWLNFKSFLVLLPVLVLMFLFNSTAPLSLAQHEISCYWPKSQFIRPIVYLLAFSVSASALYLSVLYGMEMKIKEANTWLTGQYLILFADVFILPFIKITLSSKSITFKYPILYVPYTCKKIFSFCSIQTFPKIQNKLCPRFHIWSNSGETARKSGKQNCQFNSTTWRYQAFRKVAIFKICIY